MRATQFFASLFDDYVRIAPQARRILSLVEERFGEVQNDHVAFRTFALAGVSNKDLESAFFEMGYRRHRPYEFPDKHLSALSYVPSNDDEPLIFLSEFDVSTMPTHLQAWIKEAVSQVVAQNLSSSHLLQSGRLWQLPDWETYKDLEKHSPYAAWLSVWGLCANHFTIAVHHLKTQPSLPDVVSYVQSHGFKMNIEGGLYKGQPSDLLEQASTMAETQSVSFADGSTHQIPSCYYEFARRYPDASGQFYRGFVPQSATHIFESTSHRQEGSESNSATRRPI